jgi:hypothetical protein
MKTNLNFRPSKQQATLLVLFTDSDAYLHPGEAKKPTDNDSSAPDYWSCRSSGQWLDYRDSIV